MTARRRGLALLAILAALAAAETPAGAQSKRPGRVEYRVVVPADTPSVPATATIGLVTEITLSCARLNVSTVLSGVVPHPDMRIERLIARTFLSEEIATREIAFDYGGEAFGAGGARGVIAWDAQDGRAVARIEGRPERRVAVPAGTLLDNEYADHLLAALAAGRRQIEATVVDPVAEDLVRRYRVTVLPDPPDRRLSRFDPRLATLPAWTLRQEIPGEEPGAKPVLGLATDFVLYADGTADILRFGSHILTMATEVMDYRPDPAPDCGR